MSKTLNQIVISWKFKGVSNKIIQPPTTKNNSLNSKLDYFNNSKFRVKFEGRCLRTIAKPYIPNKIIRLYIVYEIKLWSIDNTGKFVVRNFI